MLTKALGLAFLLMSLYYASGDISGPENSNDSTDPGVSDAETIEDSGAPPAQSSSDANSDSSETTTSTTSGGSYIMGTNALVLTVALQVK